MRAAQIKVLEQLRGERASVRPPEPGDRLKNLVAFQRTLQRLKRESAEHDSFSRNGHTKVAPGITGSFKLLTTTDSGGQEQLNLTPIGEHPEEEDSVATEAGVPSPQPAAEASDIPLPPAPMAYVAGAEPVGVMAERGDRSEFGLRGGPALAPIIRETEQDFEIVVDEVECLLEQLRRSPHLAPGFAQFRKTLTVQAHTKP
jgi:hypothetical protein